MKIKIISITVLCGLFAFTTSCSKKQESMQNLLDRSMGVAIRQYTAMAESLSQQENLFPRSINKETGELSTSDSRWWCSGFFPGTLWYLYKYSKDEELKDWAEQYTSRIEREKYTTNNHDVGFMLYCSFGNGLKITQNKSYNEVLETGSRSLSTRFNPNIGLIRSWDTQGKWQYPVIIDNMMNLELLMWAFKYTGDSTFYNISVSHASI